MAAVCLAIAIGPAARAAIGPSLYGIGTFGSGAGQLWFNGGGIAADPATGHLFVSEPANDRISEFTAWGEFVKAWGWGVADGSPEAQTCGPVLPTLEPEASLCQAGSGGADEGQLEFPNGIALSPNGELYVFELINNRVQVFDQAGTFVRMFGGEVNKDTGADICTAADVIGGDECGAGVDGVGPSEFSVLPQPRTANDYIDIAADGTVYVGDQNRIQVFEADGTYLKSLPLPEPGHPGALALDPVSGDIYFGYEWFGEPGGNSYRLDEETGAVIYPLPVTAAEAFAPAPGGTVFLSDDPVPSNNLFGNNPHLLELDSLGEVIDECCPSVTKPGEEATLSAATTGVVTAGGEVDLYVAHDSAFKKVGFIDVRGPAPEKFLPPPSVPPKIEAQTASSVGAEEASVRAVINPNFWADTSYHLEYGTAPCPAGCTSTTEELLGAGIVRKGVQADPIELTGLDPGETYHYRFVAESGGGGPVAGADRTFTTLAEEKDPEPCADEAFRTGAGARLADCRAYEMVSPVDKSGGDILVQGNINGHPARLDQADPTGDAISYSSYRSYGDAESSPFTSQYIARRGSTSWASEPISPPMSPPPLLGTGLDSQYQGFSEDLSNGWLYYNYAPVLAPGAVAARPNLYRRDNTAGSLEALTTAAPIGALAEGPLIELQGFSADGTRTVFRANAKLTASAAPNGTFQTYEAFKGNVRLVSVKPEGVAASGSSSAGSMGGNLKTGREGNTETAISEDGTRIYWGEEGGSLYVRVNAVKTTAVSSGAASFQAARPDGSQAIYSEGGALKRFTLVGETTETLVASGVTGVLGASEDLTRIYLVSTAALAGGAKAGEPNLYLYEEGQPLRFVATLAGSDFVATKPSPVSLSPLKRLAHVSPDAAVAVFMSRASLTGADNTDVESGEADAEVFRYEAAGDELRCVSCVSTGAAPSGRELRISSSEVSNYWYASRIPTWEFNLHEVRVIAADGDRVYFNSLNRLLAADTNGREDVYQWEAPGSGTCEDEAPGYNADAGGCVTLISSGTDGRDSEFVDASADGRDVFFLTGESLLGWDPGQVDLYDAREEGGLPAPPAVRDPECEGEACQPQGAAPPAPTPNVSESAGPGNPRFKPPCRKGFVRRHGKCVKKPHKNSKGKNSKGKNKPAKHKSRGAGR